MTIEAYDRGVRGTANDTIRVFLLEDHEILRRGVKSVLDQEPDIEVVGEGASAREAASLIDIKPDVAVIDADLSDGSGIEVCRTLRLAVPDMAIVILTTSGDDQALFSAIMAGASGVVRKRIRSIDLVDAVRRAAAGQSLLDPAMTQRVMARIREGEPARDSLALLTGQERRILELIGEGMTNRQIAEVMFLAEKTVKNYVSQMLGKLGLARRTQAAVFASKNLQS